MDLGGVDELARTTSGVVASGGGCERCAAFAKSEPRKIAGAVGTASGGGEVMSKRWRNLGCPPAPFFDVGKARGGRMLAGETNESGGR